MMNTAANESQNVLESSPHPPPPPPQSEQMESTTTANTTDTTSTKKEQEDQVSVVRSSTTKVPTVTDDEDDDGGDCSSSQLLSSVDDTSAASAAVTAETEHRDSMLIKVASSGVQQKEAAATSLPALKTSNFPTPKRGSQQKRRPPLNSSRKPKSRAISESDTEQIANSRQPFHFPPDWNNVGQLKYGTFVEAEKLQQQQVLEEGDQNEKAENSGTSFASSPPLSRENTFAQNTSQAASIYTRYRYYDRLFNDRQTLSSSSGNASSSVIMRIPDHVIPWYFRIPKIAVPNFRLPDDDRRQSSYVTVFACWNLMMGTSLLSLPWAYHHAGLVGGLLIIIAMTAVCFYTASLVLTVPQLVSVQVNEFTDLVALLLGRVAHKIAQVSSLSIIAGGCIVYWILMTNFLRHTVSFVYQVHWENQSIGMNASSVVCRTALNLADPEPPADQQDSGRFFTVLDYAVPATLVLLLGPIMCLRSVNVFLRFNIVGTLSVFFLLGFAFFKAANWGFVHVDWEDPTSPHYVHLFRWNFPIYTGVLSLALFIHNCLTTLLRTQRHPENNGRDLAIAYVLVGVTYLLISTAIYISFPLDKDCLLDNFLDNLESNDLYAFVTRLFLLLQVVTLFPLLVYMLRVQVLGLFQKDESEDRQQLLGAQEGEGDSQVRRRTPTRQTSVQQQQQPNFNLLHIVLLNALLLIGCILFATYYPQIGSVIRYCGSFSGLILVFSLPPIAYLRARELIGRPVHPLLFVLLTLIVLFGFANFAAQFFVQP